MAFPSTAAPTLQNWQVQFGDVILGGTPNPYGIIQITGLDLPPINTSDVQRPRDHGELIGLDTMAGRDVEITGDIVADTDSNAFQVAVDGLAATFFPYGSTEFPLWIQFPYLPCLASMSRVRKLNIPVDQPYSVGYGTFDIQMHATDPRLYGGVQSMITALATYPTINVTYNGNIEMRPIIWLEGPLVNPTISSNKGWTLYTTITLNAGDKLYIDLDLHVVLLFPAAGGSAVARAAINGTSIWPSYTTGVPGLIFGSNSIGVTDSSYPAGSSLQVIWSDAYLI